MPSHAEGRLGEIVLKACAFEPKDRYSSPVQMRQELEAILYNKAEGQYIYPDGDEVPQNSVHSANPGDEPPIRQEDGTVSDFGGTVSGFGKTVSDFGDTASGFNIGAEKESEKDEEIRRLRELLAEKGEPAAEDAPVAEDAGAEAPPAAEDAPPPAAEEPSSPAPAEGAEEAKAEGK